MTDHCRLLLVDLSVDIAVYRPVDHWKPHPSYARSSHSNRRPEEGHVGKRLMTETQAGGPVKAIDVCREAAQAITAKVAREQGIAMGRTGERLRNPRNRAPGWAQLLVAASHGRPAKAVEPSTAG